ncbi:MAG TPA: hypothetical protein VN228_00460 [Pyrinomonadaceae bacterium]|nr:hypothetical protein [Pyrinomonadaceae bacterium]
MPEVGNVGPNAVPPQGATPAGTEVTPVNQPAARAENLPAPVGQPGPLGQPTGLPAPLAPGQQVLPDVLAGRDPSQLAAAEQLRARGGASAVEELLGLNRLPTSMGALAAPPGNNEALRHMTPTMRRTVMRNLLDKQRGRMRHLAHLLRRGGRDGEEGAGGEGGDGRGSFAEELFAGALALDEEQIERARLELGHSARMLDLLEELLAMQDYAISQMGTFSQG